MKIGAFFYRVIELAMFDAIDDQFETFFVGKHDIVQVSVEAFLRVVSHLIRVEFARSCSAAFRREPAVVWLVDFVARSTHDIVR